MTMPEDRAETAFMCSICGDRLDDTLAVRTHELEVHGGEGPGNEVGSAPGEPPGDQQQASRPTVTGGSAPPP
jgi:hypothetical protein